MIEVKRKNENVTISEKYLDTVAREFNAKFKTRSAASKATVKLRTMRNENASFAAMTLVLEQELRLQC